MFQIEKSIPVPAHASRNAKYPFKDMEIGDSFAIPAGKQVSAAAAATKSRYGKFTTRKQADGSYRCWRIA